MAEREPPIIRDASREPGKPLLLIAKAIGLFAAVFMVSFAVFYLLRRPATLTENTAATSTPVASPALTTPAPVETAVAAEVPPAASPFGDLPENIIPGRYQWTSPTEDFFIVLYDDHTFMNRDGTIFPQYRWDLAPDSLSIQWQRSISRLTNIERPGVYIGKNGTGGIVRLEKLPPYDASQLVPPQPAASLILNATIETNSLIPILTGNEELRSSRVAGLECFQLLRKANERQAALHFQIAADLKTVPFTNALVVVEYFDAESANGGADRLSVQYDAAHGVYANVQPLLLPGDNSWQEATFFLPRPVFQNHEQNGADFRIFTSRPELFLRSVKLIRNTILPEKKMPVSVPR